MEIKRFILLFDILLLGCGCCSKDAENLLPQVPSPESHDESTSRTLHSEDAEELQHSKSTSALNAEEIQPSFTLEVIAQTDGIDTNRENENSVPSPATLKSEDDARENSSTNGMDIPEPVGLLADQVGFTASSASPETEADFATARMETKTETQEPVPEEPAVGTEEPTLTAPPEQEDERDSSLPAAVETPSVTENVEKHLEATEKKAEEALRDEDRNQAAEKMPTFAEWKEKMLAEHEKGEEQVPDAFGAQTKKKVPKSGRNYASYECGAKVLAANPEADGASRVLNELVDEYMLNPCKAKIWFVLELCEIIQVSQIEIANFELFSSMPKEFAVYTSDRYPTRDWRQLGLFTAQDQKAVQSFKLQSEGYGKYIKVELLSKYGSEHYCPLSLFRVYGTSMLEDYEQLEEKLQDVNLPTSEDDEEERLGNAERTTSRNVVDRAKDAVMSILKVLRRDQEGGETNDSARNISCSGEDSNCSIVNVSGPPLNASQKSRCQASSWRITGPAFEPCIICSQVSPVSNSPQMQTQALPVCRFLQAALGPNAGVGCSDNVDAAETTPADHVQNIYKDLSTPKGGSTISTKDSVVSGTPSTGQAEGTAVPFTDSSKLPVTAPSSWTVPVHTPHVKSASSSDVELDTLAQAAHSTTMQNSTTADASTLEGTRSLSEEKSASTLHSSCTTVDTTQDPSTATPSVAKFPAEVVTSPISPLVTACESVRASTVSKDVPLPSIVMESEKTSVPQPPDDTKVPPSVPQEGTTIDTNASTVSKEDTKEGSRHVDPGPSSGNQKESVFMRINNRIKALELNMSLSGLYLEELSQRYRKQMEDMQRNFNRTISALNETTRRAAEKDMRQQEALVQLQQRLDNVTQIMEALLGERRSLSREVFESHVCLIVIEAIVLATVFSLCLRRTRAVPAQRGASLWEGHPAMLPQTPSRAPLKRRSASESEQLDPGIRAALAEKKKRPSDESLDTSSRLLIVEPVIPIIMEAPPKEKVKKHKNKKHKGPKRKTSLPDPITVSETETKPLRDLQVTDKVSSAGVLFSTAEVLSAAESKKPQQKQGSATKCAKGNENKPLPYRQPAPVTKGTVYRTHNTNSVAVVAPKWNGTMYGNSCCTQDSKLGLMEFVRQPRKTVV